MSYGPTSKFQSSEQEQLFNLLAEHKTLDLSRLLNIDSVQKLIRCSGKKNDRKTLYMRLRGRVNQLFVRLKSRNQSLPF